MKKNLYTLLLLSIVSLSNCKKKDYDTNPQPGPEKGKTTVQSYDKITLNGDFVLHIHHSPERRGEIEIRPGKYDGSKVDYKSEGGELVIHVNDEVKLSENLIIDIFVPSLTAIRLKNSQQGIIYWDPALRVSSLDIVTEAKSNLQIYNLNAVSVTSRQEAESEIKISSLITKLITPLSVSEPSAAFFANNTVVVGNTIFKAESIAVDNKPQPIFSLLGNAFSYNLIENVNFRGEGKSLIDISEMPCRNLEIKLEGESRANAWVLNTISGKGEGKTRLNYFGDPSISYKTSGEAKIIALPLFN